ncbi:UNVERIFIED_CONTAM: hypothetical protein O8I53_06145 [Campylobacter lari]
MDKNKKINDTNKSNLLGYSQKFKKHLVYKNKPEPLDLLEIKNDTKATIARNIKDY